MTKARKTTKTKKTGASAPAWLAPTALGLGTLVGVGLLSRRASAKSSSSSSDTAVPDTNPAPTSPQADLVVKFPVYEGQDGAFMLQEILKFTGADLDWRRFFLGIARGESGFNSNMALGDRRLYPHGSQPSKYTDSHGTGEAAGARKAYKRAIDRGWLRGCPWSADAYSWGSGGWLAMLPANAWYAYRSTGLVCRHPWYLLHPADHVVVGVDFARRLMNWSAFKADPTWLTLRVGWGNPSAMDEPQARERVAQKFGDQLRGLGVSTDWMHQEVTGLPDHDIERVWDQVMREFSFDPGRKGA